MQERRPTGGDRGVFPLPFSKGDIGTLLICNVNLLFTGVELSGRCSSFAQYAYGV